MAHFRLNLSEMGAFWLRVLNIRPASRAGPEQVALSHAIISLFYSNLKIFASRGQTCLEIIAKHGECYDSDVRPC